MRLRDDLDLSTIDWRDQARLARRDAAGLRGARRDAEIDRALACEAIVHCRELLLQTTAAQPLPSRP